MKLKELAELSSVIDQARTVLNTGSVNRYPKDKLHELKKKVFHLENLFVEHVLQFGAPEVVVTPSETTPKPPSSGVFVHPPPDVPVAEEMAAGATVTTGPLGEKLVVASSLDAPVRGEKLDPAVSLDVPVTGSKLDPTVSRDVPIKPVLSGTDAATDPELVEALSKAKASLSKTSKVTKVTKSG